MQTKKVNRECSFLLNNLFSYFENSLSSEEKNRFEIHAGICKECSRIITQFASLHSLMDSGKAIEPDPFATTRILEKIKKKLEEDKRAINPGYPRFLQPALLSLVIIMGASIGFFIGKYERSSGSNNTASNKPNNLELLKTDMRISDITSEQTTFFINP
ncbi:MAG: hypothetical protein Q8867_01980 [Bacteroidota bacterium]|nr:hypothetical protein [Bacteroidota bacterium]